MSNCARLVDGEVGVTCEVAEDSVTNNGIGDSDGDGDDDDGGETYRAMTLHFLKLLHIKI